MVNGMFKKTVNDIENPADRFLVFTVFDEKAQAYSKIIGVHPTINVAIREFTIACQNPETMYNRFPGDYCLYHLGTYDERSGRITSFPEPRFVIRASEILNLLKPQSEVANA